MSSPSGETQCFYSVYLSVSHKSLYMQILIGNFLILCMLTYYLIENHRSLQLYDQTIFEAVIALFDLKHFIKNFVHATPSF